MPSFLAQVLKQIRAGRPLVPASLNYTVRTERNVTNTLATSGHATIYFRTRGCRFSNFACTMCDYWISDQVPASQMVASFQAAMASLDFVPNEVLVNVSGSFFDDWEVPPAARTGIFELLATFPDTKFIFEAHAHDITVDKIEECARFLRPESVRVEMGLESANPWVLKYAVGKMLDTRRLLSAVAILKECGIGSIVNVMVGTPFLSEAEMIADSVSTVNWAFEKGIDRCVLFPMNTKPWTLVYWMDQHDQYTRPPLWALVDVLARLDPSHLPHTGIAWHRTRPQLHPHYSVPNEGPSTCPVCYERVMTLLDTYVLNADRPDVTRHLVEVKCACKDQWNAQVATPPVMQLTDRLRAKYAVIGREVLGSDWWSEHGPKVLEDIEEPDLAWFKPN